MSNDAKITPLGGLAQISAGYPLRTSASALAEGDVHLLQLQHVDTEFDIEWAKVPKVELPSERGHTWLSDNDVVFAARGTRTFAYSLKNTPKHAVCAPQFFVISPSQRTAILPEYLAWHINQRPCQEYLTERATGATIPNVRRQVLEEMPITVPPISTQRIFVAFWRSAREERAVLNRLIQNRKQQLEALAVGLFHQSPKGAA
jgi:hypothetical protein